MPENNSNTQRLPVVLIIGAGLGGLMMGALLERVGITYQIFERANKVKPLGSAMSLGPNILPVFEQLGLMDELMKISLPVLNTNIHDKDLKKLGSLEIKGQKEITGYDTLLFARPRLYELLLKQVPEDKIFMGKRVLRTEENEDQVVIHCADNSIYQGDILIGADGAYSGVRQSLYKRLEEKNLLPNEDTKSFSIGHTLMVGVAELKDLEKYPQLKNPHSVMNHVIGGDNKAWSVCNVPDGQVCWGLIYQYRTAAESREQQFRNSEWGSESNEAMIKEFRHLPCVYGGTMGDLIDATPKDLSSRVFLEDKIFTTWFHGRTVLIGDACHKMLPWAGQGAINAMQDAVILANCFYDLTDASPSSITAAFQDYYKQRYSHAKAMVEASRLISRAIAGQHLWERALRHVLLHYVPDAMQQWNLAKTAEYRPQITFLPLIEKRGTGPVLPQKPSKRYSEEQAKKIVAI